MAPGEWSGRGPWESLQSSFWPFRVGDIIPQPVNVMQPRVIGNKQQLLTAVSSVPSQSSSVIPRAGPCPSLRPHGDGIAVPELRPILLSRHKGYEHVWLGRFASVPGACCVQRAHHAEALTRSERAVRCSVPCVLRAPTRRGN